MAYCVHCGVKLAPSETKCPLCGVPALDPLEKREEIAARPYPVRTPEQQLIMRDPPVVVVETRRNIRVHAGASRSFIARPP